VLKDPGGRGPDNRDSRNLAWRDLFESGVAASVVDAVLENANEAADPLTARERQILQLVAEGNTTKEIARLLNVSFKTAESHRNHIMKKLDIHEVAGLVRYAIRQGLLHP